MDRRRGRVHVRQQVRRRRFTRFTDVDHIAGPLGIPLVAIPGIGIVGRFERLSCPWQLAVRLEVHARDGVILRGASRALHTFIMALPGTAQCRDAR
jgi:hypothetical protein